MISFLLGMFCLFGLFGPIGGVVVWVALAILSAPSYLSGGGRFPRRATIKRNRGFRRRR
jgi:hypothetical protein